MSSSTEQRRLAAIMFTDMVGYTALSHRNEALALELLEEHRRILRPIFPRFNGTEIKTIGDAFLVEFQSALEAAQCALEIQRTLAKRNHDVSSEHRIELRIGIHVGDVVHREGDVYGDGVNIASRIQPVAGIGGICISVDVERQIHNALEARFEKLAPIELKNVEVPMDLFRIVLPWERKPEVRDQKSEVRKSSTISKSRKSALIGALVLLLIIGFGWWWTAKSRRNPGSSAAPSIAAITEKSIAVLPFENLSRDPDNAFFTDGVQDQILTALSKVADLKVISRTSVMQYKSGQPRNLREIAQQLGVTHVLEGSVQRAGNKVRVNAQLINARTDAHEWADNYDRPVDDVFAIQSEIAKAIADQLQAKLSPNEKTAIAQPPTTDVTAFDLYSRARTLMLTTAFSTTGTQNMLKAVDLLNQAISRDSSFFLAYCQLALAHDQVYFLGFDHTPARLALAEAAIQAAFGLRPAAGECHLARAENLYRGYLDYDGALTELAIARQTLPNDPRIDELTGYILRRRGQAEEGLRNLKRAGELDPRNYFTLQQIAISYQFLRRYPEAISALDRALTIVPKDVDVRVARASTEFYWKADTRPLHQTIESILRENPGTIATAADGWFYCALSERDPEAAKRALVALGENDISDSALILHRQFCEGLLARMMQDGARARTAFTAARDQQEKIVQAQPGYGPALCVLGLIDAGLGNKQQALEEGRRALALLPVTQDSMNGGTIIGYFAIIAAWTGEKDLALEELTKAAGGHYWTIPTTYGGLKLLPWWDPLRGDPRFEKIIASLAPK